MRPQRTRKTPGYHDGIEKYHDAREIATRKTANRQTATGCPYNKNHDKGSHLAAYRGTPEPAPRPHIYRVSGEQGGWYDGTSAGEILVSRNGTRWYQNLVLAQEVRSS